MSKRGVVWIALALVCSSLVLALAHAGSAGKGTVEKEVRAAVQMLIDGWREANASKVEAVLHPQARLVTLRANPEDLQTDTPERLLTMVRRLSPGNWDDRLQDVEIRVDDTGIATLWARYEFFIDGKRSHCGRVLFHLYRLGGAWKVVNFADTHSPGHCT